MEKLIESIIGTSTRPAECHGIGGSDADLDWEDWDPKSGSFVHHMIAGSLAGIAEHTVMFPVDTIKTFIQCQECTLSGCLKQQASTTGLTSLEAATRLVQQEGFFRLWRGVSTMLSACIPAHAAYFSALESCKERFGVNGREHNVIGAAAAGALATVFHDSIMTPMDVIKQRLQLGYYRGLFHCATSIARQEGLRAFYLSLPVTLFMNIPYGCVMVAANESIKRIVTPSGDYSLGTYLVAGSGAGALAAAATTPLDLLKTRLQTQVTGAEIDLGTGTVGPSSESSSSGGSSRRKGVLSSSSSFSSGSGSSGSSGVKGGIGGTGTSTGGGAGGPPYHPTSSYISPLAASSSAATEGSRATPAALGPASHHQPSRTHVTSTDSGCLRAERTRIKYKGIVDAARQIHAAEGYAGFFRGMVPRLLVHTPSVAISWTTYETVKEALGKWTNDG